MNDIEFNNLCKECKGKCCKEEPIRMDIKDYVNIKKYLLGGEPSYEVANHIAQTVLGVKTIVDINPTGTKCLALGENGCRVPKEIRPSQCNMFPWVVESNKTGMGPQFLVIVSSRCIHYKSVMYCGPTKDQSEAIDIHVGKIMRDTHFVSKYQDVEKLLNTKF